ncbi:restriction endonuclease [Paraburkholderia bryophila]|uniref:nSTAND3 domain-containing NTPase n=1 Tax=Paraburkholderia bryophila TaxID=420952 RepID=UPI00234C021D|nr:restriction endonuclease [Paraburkholderia bryophila]WCM24664.1 restriction endonuclease [Paraburkholderia bryophila]
MPNYDFHELSPYDFEILTRDLLQAEWKIRLESFKTGSDGGIDLRYAEDGNKTIVQCKHYLRTGLAGLLKTLKKEATKIRKLNPQKYYVVTSLPLSPANKDEIVATIGANILSPSNVLGQEDLNNLLGRNETVERQHYKLWLASVPVLNKIINNATFVNSSFAVKKAKAAIQTHVQTQTFAEAMAMLRKSRVVIIAGPPGVGKTTMANILLYEHVREDYEAIVVQENPREASQMFQDGVRQIFYYDDFMGTAFLGDREGLLSGNRDRTLLELIAMIRDSMHARLILTTRDHLFNQALSHSERFRHANLADEKIVLQMSNYGQGERARILYNHVHFSELPVEYQSELLDNDFYMEIVRSSRFNPRLVEWMASYQRVSKIPVEQYKTFVRTLLNNPSEIWRHAFHEQISDAARSLLLALYSIGGSADVTDLESLFSSIHSVRAARYTIHRKPNDFNLACKELIGSFIEFFELPTHEILKLTDPSLIDLMDGILLEEPDNGMDLITGAMSFSQINRLFLFAIEFDETRRRLCERLQQHADTVRKEVRRILTSESHRIGTGRPRADNPSFERRLHWVLQITDEWRDVLLMPLVEDLYAQMTSAWCNGGPTDIESCARLVKLIDESSMQSLRGLTEIMEACTSAMVHAASRGCSSRELAQLLSALQSPSDTNMAETLRNGYEKYRHSRFDAEISECKSAAEFGGMVSDLRIIEDVLEIDISEDIAEVESCESIVAQGDARQADLDAQYWTDHVSAREMSTDEIRGMFASLRIDRD